MLLDERNRSIGSKLALEREGANTVVAASNDCTVGCHVQHEIVHRAASEPRCSHQPVHLAMIVPFRENPSMLDAKIGWKVRGWTDS